jgi:hypothetical protein
MKSASNAGVAIVLVAIALGACAHDPPPRSPTSPTSPHGDRGARDRCRRDVPACSASPPTYSADVRPILERHCLKCHAGDGIAADEHDFSHVETLRAQSAALTSEMHACAMPPSSEPPLADAEAAVLLAWAACARSRPGDPVPEREP